MYTLEDMEEAKAELSAWLDRFDRYTGNNPNKYQSDIRAARRKVSEIESSLKADGTIPFSDTEFLEKELDCSFPQCQKQASRRIHGANISAAVLADRKNSIWKECI